MVIERPVGKIVDSRARTEVVWTDNRNGHGA